MRALIISDETKQKIKEVITYAEEHPFTLEYLHRMTAGKEIPMGNIYQHVCHIPIGFRAVYSIELQNKKVRHLSVSYYKKKRPPTAIEMEEIMKLFGFKNKIKNCMVAEEITVDRSVAINVLEIIE